MQSVSFAILDVCVSQKRKLFPAAATVGLKQFLAKAPPFTYFTLFLADFSEQKIFFKFLLYTKKLSWGILKTFHQICWWDDITGRGILTKISAALLP